MDQHISPRDAAAFGLARGSSGFSLKLLLACAFVLAITFAIIGYVARDWSTGQVRLLFALVTGMIALLAIVVYANQIRRRATVRKFGGILCRVDGPLGSRMTRVWLLISLVAAYKWTIVLLISYVELAVDEDEDGSLSWSALDLCSPMMFWFVFSATAATYVSRGGKLELREHGVCSQAYGVPWNEVLSTRWSRHQAGNLVIVVKIAGGGGMTNEADVPIASTRQVDEVLSHKLGSRHAPRANDNALSGGV